MKAITRPVVVGLLIASLCRVIPASAQDNASSTVGCYHFDEGQGQWACDASAAENHGTLGTGQAAEPRDPKWVSGGKEGGALEFDGQDDVVTIPNSVSPCLGRGIEVEAWVCQKRRTPFARVLDKHPCFDMYIHEDGTPVFRFRGAEAHGIRGGKPVPLNEWAHIKATCNDKTLSIFLNGEKIGSRPYTDPIPNQPSESRGDLRIGNAHFARPFCGLIDEVKIVNVGYTPPAVAAFESDADTVGLWHLDDGQAADAGPNKLNGEVRGAPPAPGKIGTALRFDGKGCVQIPHHASLDVQDELTIDCWVKQAQRSPYARIVEKDDWTYGLWINDGGAADFFYRPANGGSSHTLSEVELPLKRWVHIRAEFDGLEAIIYFDGKEVAREAVTVEKQTIDKSEGDLFIGSRRLGDRGFIGLIDEVRISNTVRRARPPLQTRIASYPSKSTWTLRVNARGTRGKAASVRGTIKTEDGQTVHTINIPKLDRGTGQTVIDVSGFAPATYLISMAAYDADGRQVAEETTEFVKPAAPPWLGAKTGVSNEVLPPWTPMSHALEEDGALAVRCWGRKHAFVGPLPERIESADAELLAGPVRLVVVSDGRELSYVKGDVTTPQGDEHQLSVQGTASAGAIKAPIQVTIEYDGMTRFDMSLTADEPTEIDSACIEIPLRAAHATLVHHPGRWFEDATCAGALPADGWRSPSAWYLWLGDEERGLCWFAEDQEAWGLDPKKPGIEAIRDGDIVRLRFYLINAETKLDGPREFTWGLMATPVRPLPQGWQRWRFGSPNGPVTIGVRWSTLQSSRWHSFPVPPDPDAYHADVKKAHDAGKKFVPYTNFNMQSDTGPEWTYWGEEWNAHAGEGKAADVLAMDVVNVRCCAMTPSWCDFIAWKYKTFLEEYDSDGFYLDNSSPGQCRNTAHPPEHHRRRHIFAARELMKRFYTVTKQNDPGNVMVCHMSSTLCIPVLSFCDAIVDGEQYGWALDEKFDGHYIPITPLARVRAELMAHQWGLVPLFLPCNRGPNPWSPKLMRELLALCLPHGMRFWLAGDPKTMAKVLDVIDAFDLPNSRFVPYWSVPEWRRTAKEEGIVVSAYAREGKAMLIIANLRGRPQDVEIGLDPKGLGIERPSPAPRDPLDNLPVSRANDALRLRIDEKNLRVILLDTMQ